MIIRYARKTDAPAVKGILDREITTGMSNFDLECKSIDEVTSMIESHQPPRHPFIVAEEGSTFLGFAELSTYRIKKGYDTTVELSVYVAAGERGKKIGRHLVEYLVDYARKQPEIHCIVSVITSTNTVSRKLHESLGFKYCGTIPEVGLKFGTWLGTDFYQLMV